MYKLTWKFFNSNVQISSGNQFVIEYYKGEFILFKGFSNYQQRIEESRGTELEMKFLAEIIANEKTKVKKLLWRKDCYDNRIADTPFGSVFIFNLDNFYSVKVLSSEEIRVNTLQEAYKVASEEYTKAVLQAIL